MSATLAPSLTRSDAYLLAALTDSNGRGTMRLRDMIGHYDWLRRDVPTFDDVSFGLPRLVATGYVDVAADDLGVRLRATRSARTMRAAIKAKTLGDVLAGMAAAVGALPHPAPEIEDRSLGRLAVLDRPTWDGEARAYHDSWSPGSMMQITTTSAAVAAVAAIVVFWQRRRRRGPGGKGPGD